MGRTHRGDTPTDDPRGEARRVALRASDQGTDSRPCARRDDIGCHPARSRSPGGQVQPPRSGPSESEVLGGARPPRRSGQHPRSSSATDTRQCSRPSRSRRLDGKLRDLIGTSSKRRSGATWKPSETARKGSSAMPQQAQPDHVRADRGLPGSCADMPGRLRDPAPVARNGDSAHSSDRAGEFLPDATILPTTARPVQRRVVTARRARGLRDGGEQRAGPRHPRQKRVLDAAHGRWGSREGRLRDRQRGLAASGRRTPPTTRILALDPP